MRHLLALLFVACAPLAFQVDPAFTFEQRSEIARAADTWNAITVPWKRITLHGGAWRIEAVEHTEQGYNGWCSSSERLIQIDSDPQGASTYAVALHEMGHALGLHHTATGVMMPYTVSVEFTADVLSECKRVGACQ